MVVRLFVVKLSMSLQWLQVLLRDLLVIGHVDGETIKGPHFMGAATTDACATIQIRSTKEMDP